MSAERSTHDAAKAAGITYRQLDHWCRRGYLTPDHPGGIGVPRHWTVREVAVLQTMAQLVHLGFTARAAARLARDGQERAAVAAALTEAGA
jgi:DNA-binding transcriptional MerR regulator